MRDDSQNISQADFDFVINVLEKWIDQPLELQRDATGKYVFSAKIENSDYLNLKLIVIKKGIDNNLFGFALLYDNHRIKGIDWKVLQRLDDGQTIENCYHCNDWNANSQDADKHFFDEDINTQLRTLDNENAIRYVLKRWNIRCATLEQLRLTGL